MTYKEANKYWEDGYNCFFRDEDPPQTFRNGEYQSPGYYFTCGWTSAEWEDRDRKEKNARPECPCCGQKLNTFLSGLFCEDEEECKYHTHEPF